MGSTYVERLENTQRDLASYFDKNAAIVRSNFDRFEKQIGRPAIAYSLASFESHPFTTTFLAIFSFLACLPIISFIGFSLFVIASITFVASALGLIIIVLIEGVLVTILLVTLTSLLIFSLILSPLALFGYLTFMFLVHVRNEGRAGASQWAAETKKQFARKTKLHETTDGSEVSMGSGSVVIVEAKEEDSPRIDAVQAEGG